MHVAVGLVSNILLHQVRFPANWSQRAVATPPYFATSSPFRSKRGNIFPRMSMDGHNCTGNPSHKLIGPAPAEKQGHGLAVLIGEKGDGVAFVHVTDAGAGL